MNRKSSIDFVFVALVFILTMIPATGRVFALSPVWIDSQLSRENLQDGRWPVLLVLQSNQGRDERSRASQLVTAAGGESELQIRRIYGSFPVVAASLTPNGLSKLRSSSDLLAIRRDGRVRAFLSEGTKLVRADRARALGYSGAGQVVAIVDTGIDYRHSELGGGDLPNAKVIGGYDFANSDSDPKDDQGHGTSVAGIVASSAGVAPSAKLLAVKVLDEDGEGSDSDVLAGIDWAIQKKNTLGTTVINLSLGGDHSTSACDSQYPDYAAAARAASAAGIVIVAASGNEAKDDRIASPACISSIVSVGAVYDADGLDGREYCEQYDPLGVFCTNSLCKDNDPDADEITCYSNASKDLDILAPSHDCRTTKKGGGWENDFGGTSAATPYTAGVVALVLEAGGARSAEAIASTLRSTGRPIVDSRNGLTFSRIDAEAAVKAVVPTCTIPPAPGKPSVPSLPIVAGVAYEVTWSSIPDVSEYEIEEHKGSIGTVPNQARRTPLLRASFTHAGPPETYVYRVRALRTCGAGPFSETASVRVLGNDAPGSFAWNAVVAGAGHLRGAGGSIWRTDLSIFNPGSTATGVFVAFLPATQDNSNPKTEAFSLAASESLVLEDAVQALWPSDASGAFAIGSDSSLVVQSRTRNVGSATGSFGQDFPGQPPADGIVPGEVADLLLLASSDDTRTNIGFVNLSSSATVVEVKLFGASGAIGTYERTVFAYGQHQDFDVLASLASSLKPDLRAEIRIKSGSGPLLSYASVVDRRTGDPSTVIGKARRSGGR